MIQTKYSTFLLLRLPLGLSKSGLTLFKYIENFTTKKTKISDKSSDIFHVSAQIMYRGYSLEPPQNGYPQYMFLSRIKKNNVYPCKRLFYYLKVGFKGVKIIYMLECFRDVNGVVLILNIAYDKCPKISNSSILVYPKVCIYAVVS